MAILTVPYRTVPRRARFYVSCERSISYLGILGYLDKGGGACAWPSLDNPGMAKLLGNPGILGQGGGMCVAIPGQSWDG